MTFQEAITKIRSFQSEAPRSFRAEAEQVLLAEIESLRGACEKGLDAIERLADQQAVPDDWWSEAQQHISAILERTK